MRIAAFILFSCVWMTSGCVSANRDRYVELRTIMLKRDGSPAADVPIRVFLRSDWRSMLGAGLQDLIPICRASSDKDGRITCLLEDFYGYTIVAGEKWRTWVPLKRKEVAASAKEPIKIVVQ